MIVKWMAAPLAAAVLALAPAVPAQAGAHHHKPGRVLSAQPLPASLWLPGTAAAHRIRYTSTGLSGRPVAVAGAVFIPEGTAPRHGWPVVSWAHGTVGIADGCAQSVGGRSARDITYLSAWLRAGYAVVATEYKGLGTPGPHPYLHGASRRPPGQSAAGRERTPRSSAQPKRGSARPLSSSLDIAAGVFYRVKCT
ncbi:hypothetical protein [Nonomuraea sp. NPDC049480]|uniref:hypothetical protein n=1 Tax=Nonomuraea sp. NPDC049480 TaxID=3364353 RepID=UPI0037B92A7C